MIENKILKILESGFKRFYSEGYSKWSKDNLVAAIQSVDSAKNISDPEVQNILKELENKGLIILRYKQDCYLEVLHD